MAFSFFFPASKLPGGRVRSTGKITVLALIFVAKFVLQYSLIDPVYDLHRDEYLHLDQGRHLAWGYLSVPPFTSWTSWIILLLGGGEFWVKFFPALFGALTIVVVWRTVEELEGGWFALILATCSVFFSVLLRINTLYQPNSFDILAWTMCYYLLIRYLKTEQNRWLYFLGVSVAFGFLNKYNILFLLAGVAPAILLTAHRRIFSNAHLYGAAALSLLIVLPNLLWQFREEFPVLWHMKVLAESQLVNVERMDFVKEQFLFFGGAIFVVIAGLLSLALYTRFSNWRLFFWSFAFTFALFIFLRAKGYYAIGLYPVIIAFGAVFLEEKTQSLWGRRLRAVLLIIPVVSFLPLYFLAFPNRGPEEIRRNPEHYRELGLLRWEDGKDHALPQDFADMLGWRELARKVDSVYATVPEKENTIVICDNYGQAGAINYYTRHKDINAVSFSADYPEWFDLGRKVRHIIMVNELEEGGNDFERERQLFRKVLRKACVTNTDAREHGTCIYLLENAVADINAILREEILETKRSHSGLVGE